MLLLTCAALPELPSNIRNMDYMHLGQAFCPWALHQFLSANKPNLYTQKFILYYFHLYIYIFFVCDAKFFFLEV